LIEAIEDFGQKWFTGWRYGEGMGSFEIWWIAAGRHGLQRQWRNGKSRRIQSKSQEMKITKSKEKEIKQNKKI
jgi:hypothetical protein